MWLGPELLDEGNHIAVGNAPMLSRTPRHGIPDLAQGNPEEVELALQIPLLGGGAFRAGDRAEPQLEPLDQSIDIHRSASYGACASTRNALERELGGPSLRLAAWLSTLRAPTSARWVS